MTKALANNRDEEIFSILVDDKMMKMPKFKSLNKCLSNVRGVCSFLSVSRSDAKSSDQ